MSDSSSPLEQDEQKHGLEKELGKKRSVFGIILKAAFFLLLLLLLPVFFFLIRPTTFDLSRFAEKIDSQITEALGREVSIEGDILFVTGFVPSVRVEKITVDNPEGWRADGHFAYLERFETSVDLTELFHQEVNIDDVQIDGLTLFLERNAEGLGNWEGFAALKSDAETGEAIIPGSGVDDEIEGLDLDFKELGGISIENIRVNYREPGQPEKTVFKLDHLEGSAKYGEAVQLSLDGKFLKLPFHGKIKAGTLTDLRARKVEWPYDLNGKLGSTSFHMEGQLSARDFTHPGIIRFDLEVPHLVELLPFTGELPKIEPIQLSGEARRTSKNHYTMPELTGRIGEDVISGSIDLDISGRLPRIDGGLEISSINLEVFRKDEKSRVNKKVEIGDVGEEILEKLPESILPLLGRLRLKIGKIRGIAKETSIKNIDLKITVETGEAVATVDAEFAKIPLSGRLALSRNKLNNTLSFNLNLNSEQAEVSKLIAYYSHSDRFMGRFKKLRYKIGGTGKTLVKAWYQRQVALEINDAEMTYRGGGEEWRFIVSKATMLRKGREPGEVHLSGVISEAPFDVSLTYELEIMGENAGAYLNSLQGTIADLEFRIENKIDEEAERGDANFSFSLKGGSLDKLDLVYEMDLPPMGPYSAKGVFQKTGSVFDFHQLELEVGSSRMKGAWRYEEGDERPLLSLDLNAATLQVDDFSFDQWSPTGSKKETPSNLLDKGGLAQATVLPSVLSYQILSRFDMRLNLEVGEVLSGKDKLGQGSLTAVLENSRLKIEPLKLAVPGGYFEGHLMFHPKVNGTLDWKIHLSADSFEIGVLARRAKPDSTLSALANIDADLSAENAPFGRPQLKEATGKLNIDVCPRNVDAGALDVWATNLIWAILPTIGTGNQSKINCLIAHLRLENGVIYPETLALDTSRLRVVAEGKIDLARDQYDLKLTPFPKNPQMFSMELPVGVEGALDSPKIETGTLSSVRALGRIAANTALFPVKFIANKRLPEDGNDLCPCVKERPSEKQKKESAASKKEKKKGFFKRLFGN
ncbi:MAG: AsmA family protein [Verrucomicrobia bacterium]|nr:AsmA family protein [Verrucomicrobiota bacterium]